MTDLVRIPAAAIGTNWAPRLLWMAVMLLLAGLPVLAKVRSDWSRVQAVPPSRPMTVWLYKDKAQPAHRKIVGRFKSATAASITLLLPEGRSRTMERTSVRKVLVRRPFKKRWPGWAALVVSATALELFCAVGVDDCNFGVLPRLQAHGLITGLITGGFFGGSRNVGIYNVPPKQRIPQAGIRPPCSSCEARVARVVRQSRRALQMQEE